MNARDESVNGRDQRKIYPIERRLIVLQDFAATVANILTFLGLLLILCREYHNYQHHL